MSINKRLQSTSQTHKPQASVFFLLFKQLGLRISSVRRVLALGYFVVLMLIAIGIQPRRKIMK